MNATANILFKSFVKPFYKENAGSFVFVLIMMFCVVSKVDGADFFEYHYSLIIGMLKSYSFLLLVFGIWFLYVKKCITFVTGILQKPEYHFLQIFHCSGGAKQFRFFLFVVEFLLMLPVLIYATFVVVVGLKQQLYLPVLLVLSYLTTLLLTASLWHVKVLANYNKTQAVVLRKHSFWTKLPTSFLFIIFRFIAGKQKLIWLGIKVFTCGILYLIARNNKATDVDISFVFLFFNMGVLVNGILIHRTREFEETYLAFYRNFHVTLVKRFTQYAAVYFVLLLPEIVTIISLTPAHINYTNAIYFSLCAYGVVLLLNSISFLQNFTQKQYLKVMLLVFCLQYFIMILFGLAALSAICFMLALVFFAKNYFLFERKLE